MQSPEDLENTPFTLYARVGRISNYGDSRPLPYGMNFDAVGVFGLDF